MIFNNKGLAFPDYQLKSANFFINSDKHDVKQWEFCKKYIKNFRTCIEFGSHVGTSAIQYSPHFKQVFSFEPVPALFECLQYNTKNLNNVKIHNLAISNQNGTTEIYVNPRNPGSNVIPSKATQKTIDKRWGNESRLDFQKMKDPIVVKTISLDSLNLTDVDFIKIDTEGYNMEPLRGMQKTLEKFSPVIMLEQDRKKNEGPIESEIFLKDLGYKLIKRILIDDIYIKEN